MGDKNRAGKLARLATWLVAAAICGANTLPVTASIPVVIRPTSPPPQVLPRIDGFTPLSGAVGTRITITGVNLGNVVSVKIGDTTAPLISKTTSSVSTSVPDGARSGDISVATDADDTARSAAEFNVIETRVQSFSPSSGPVNTVVTLSGSGLGHATQVKFGSVTAPIDFKTDNQITTRVPATAPASDFITVVTPTGNPKTDRPFGHIAAVVTAPAVRSLTPTSGPVGTSVVIAGANLSGVTSVKFNGVSANFDITSPTEIRAIVPSGATSGRVTVARGTQSAESATNFSVTTSTTRSIVGRITDSANSQRGIANVAVRRYQNGRFEEKRTDASGNYVFTNLAAGAHLIIPIQSGVVFSNTQGVGFINITVETSSISGVDFKGRRVDGVFSLAGKITNKSGAPMPGVYVFASNLLASGGAMTNDLGEYRFINLPAGFYLFHPVKSGHVFDPSTRLGNLAVNSVGNDFRVTTAPVAPANDAFATPQVLPGINGRATGSNASATKQVGEPNHANIPTGQSLWYRWTAPSNGLLTLTTAGSTTTFTSGTAPTDTVLAVYTGTAVNALTAIGANNDVSTTDRTSRVVVSVVAGRSYLIALDTPYFLFGNLVLNYSFAATTSATPTPTPVASAPANDNFAQAQAITGTSGRVTGRNTGATKESGEPVHHGVSGGHSVWYRWTAPSNGTATFTTAGSTFDSVLAVYSGTTVSALTKIVSNDDAATGVGTSSVSFSAVTGRVYFIAVDGYRTAVGNVVLNWSQVLDRGPRNDDFVNAQVIANASGRATGTLVDADKETGEPLHNGNAGGHSVWYRWTAPSAGTVTFDTIGSAVDTVLAVYNGTAVNALTRVASDDDSGGNRTSRVSFSTVAGRVYFIAVDGYNGASGSIVLNWSSSGGGGGAPANDNFANAQNITGKSGRVTGSNVGATFEVGESLLQSTSQGKSIWYRWTAPASGVVNFNTNGSSFDTILAAFTATAFITSDDDSGAGLSSLLSFNAVAGTTYFLEVADATSGATGSVVLNWILSSGGGGSPPNDNVANAQNITGTSGRVTGSNVGATFEVGESLLQSTSQGKSIWYRWTAPASGVATFGTSGSSFDTILGVFTATAFIGSNDDGGGGLSSLLSFNAVAGTTYFLEVADATSGATGSVVLNWSLSSGAALVFERTNEITTTSDQSTLGMSPVVLSTATVRGDLIELRFSGALDTTTVKAVGNYEVTCNGAAISIQSALPNVDTSHVNLQLPRALEAGERIVLRYHGLHDAQNRLLREADTQITAR